MQDYLEQLMIPSADLVAVTWCDEQLHMATTVSNHGFCFYAKEIDAIGSILGFERRVDFISRCWLPQLVQWHSVVARTWCYNKQHFSWWKGFGYKHIKMWASSERIRACYFLRSNTWMCITCILVGHSWHWPIKDQIWCLLSINYNFCFW